jgi:hypothetical protein
MLFLVVDTHPLLSWWLLVLLSRPTPRITFLRSPLTPRQWEAPSLVHLIVLEVSVLGSLYARAFLAQQDWVFLGSLVSTPELSQSSAPRGWVKDLMKARAEDGLGPGFYH